MWQVIVVVITAYSWFPAVVQLGGLQINSFNRKLEDTACT